MMTTTTTTIPQTLFNRLVHANGKRRKRTLSANVLAGLIGNVETGLKTYDYATGGTVSASYGRSTMTTVVFVARRERDGAIVADVRTCPAHCASPGRAWLGLRPWRPDLESMLDKIQSWAESPDRIVVG